MVGAEAMDAIAFLENKNIKVIIIEGSGKVKRQSVAPGTSLNKVKTINLNL